MKPLLSNKCRLPINVTLLKENDVISDNGKIAVFNDLLTKAVKNFNITVSGNILCEANNIKDPALEAIEKYKKHPSIKAIAGISKYDNFIKEYLTKKFCMK